MAAPGAAAPLPDRVFGGTLRAHLEGLAAGLGGTCPVLCACVWKGVGWGGVSLRRGGGSAGRRRGLAGSGGRAI